MDHQPAREKRVYGEETSPPVDTGLYIRGQRSWGADSSLRGFQMLRLVHGSGRAQRTAPLQQLRDLVRECLRLISKFVAIPHRPLVVRQGQADRAIPRFVAHSNR